MTFDETSGRAPVPRAAAPSAREIDATLNARLRELKTAQLHEDPSASRAAFLYLEDFLPRDYTERLIDAVHAVTPAVNRNYLPGHKQGGSVSRHAIDRLAPFIADLYRSEALVGGSKQSAATRCNSRPPTTRMPTRSITTPVRATTSAGTTTRPITKAAVTRCCSA